MLKLVKRAFSEDWKCPDGMHPLLHKLLAARGISSDTEARTFLNPSKEQLHDPFLLNDMREAVDIINDAIRKGEGICVYGDYDVDGVCASSILVMYLKELGVKCKPYLPSRHNEGYGLNNEAIDSIAADGYGLLVSVDCGITAHDLVEHAKQCGMRVVITDHHRPDDNRPECPCVDPLLGDYPFGFLCGAGVAFKLVHALAGLDKALEYIDLAAIATIADIVPLKDENRVIASLGLERINSVRRPGLQALLDAACMGDKPLTSGNIAFQVSPRINASGRMDDAMLAFRLMTGTDISECKELAEELNGLNEKRRGLENEAVKQAEEKLEDYDFAQNRVIAVAGDSWNQGVIGLAASKLVEKYNYPTIVLTKADEEFSTGSCRSIDGIDIHDALTHVNEPALMERFGGHKMAAGLKIRTDLIDELRNRLNRYLSEKYPPETWMPCAEYDAEAQSSQLTIELVNELEKLAPTGCGNPAPLLLMNGQPENEKAVGADGSHLKLDFRSGDGSSIPCIWFRNGNLEGKLPQKARLLFSPALNTFRNTTNVQADVKYIEPSDALELLEEAESDDELRFAAFLVERARCFGKTTKEQTESGFARAVFKNSIQGSAILCADCKTAKRFADLPADFKAGSWTNDRRVFNQISVCSEGADLSNYANVYCAGLPDFLSGAMIRLRDVPVSRYFEHVPSIEELRNVLRACYKVAKTGKSTKNVSGLLIEIAEESGVSFAACAMSISVFERMKFISLTEDGGIIKLESEKKDPLNDELYNAYLSLEKK